MCPVKSHICDFHPTLKRSSYLRMKPPLMAICSRSSTTRAGWLATTPSWLFPQALLAPLFILATGSDGEKVTQQFEISDLPFTSTRLASN